METPPPQRLLRELIAGAEIYTEAVRDEALESLCSVDTVVCMRCGFSADTDQIQSFHAAQRAATGLNVSDLVNATARQGYGMFDVAIRAPSWKMDASSVDLLCTPCWHAAHMVIPRVQISGRIGLVPVMSQEDIIHMWRMMMLAADTGQRQAPQVRTSLETFYAEAQNVLLQGLGIAGGTSVFTNDHLGYWLAYAPADIYERAAKFLPDLRFLPINDWGSFGTHLEFAKHTDVLGLAQTPAAA